MAVPVALRRPISMTGSGFGNALLVVTWSQLSQLWNIGYAGTLGDGAWT